MDTILSNRALSTEFWFLAVGILCKTGEWRGADLLLDLLYNFCHK